MIIDETEEFRGILGPDLQEAVDALQTLKRYFSRETLSAAMGEISELLVASYIGAVRVRRGTRGYDLLLGDERIEVKSRIIGLYSDRLQFNFRHHTANASTVFCILWEINEQGRLHLKAVFRVSVQRLLREWGTPNQARYCARTTYGRIRHMAVRG